MSDFVYCMTNKKSSVQLFYFGIVGVASNLTGYLCYLLITFLGGSPKTTMSILYAVAATIGFFGNRKLTFAHSGSLLGAGIRYLFAHCCGYMINLTILIVAVDKLGYPHQWVQAVAILIVALFLFLTFKFFVFKKEEIPNRGNE